MRLYLVQHGAAVPEVEHPDRPLSAPGHAEVERVARAAGRSGLDVNEIRHSGKRRAQETAEILAAHLRPNGGVSQMPGLAPLDDPRLAWQAVLEFERPVMLVGHLPHLSRLVSALLVGDPAPDIVAFRMGGIVCLGRGETGWRVEWILTPELV